MIEDVLKALFDFQRFEGNAELEALIRDTDGRWDEALSDDVLGMVSAAGDALSSALPAEEGDRHDKR